MVSVAKGAFLSHSAKELPDYLYIPALDREHYQLDRHFEQTFDFIDNNLRKTNVDSIPLRFWCTAWPASLGPRASWSPT